MSSKYPNFLKLAALFDPPPQMLSRLKMETAQFFAGLVLFTQKRNRRARWNKENGPQNIEESNKVIEECYKYTFQEIDPLKETKREFLLKWNVDEWKYLNEQKVKEFKNLARNGKVNTYIQVKFEVFPIRSFEGEGQMDYNNNTLSVFFKYYKNVKTVEDFNLYLQAILTTADHELIHACQYMLSEIFGDNAAKKPFGLPSKKPTDPNYTFQGVNIKDVEDYYNSKEKNPYVKPKPISVEQEHPLIDIEFYTNLKDSVNAFRYALSNETDPAIKKELFKMWVFEPNKYIQMKTKKLQEDENEKQPVFVSAREPFITLKRHSPAKYQKAVKILYNEFANDLK